MTLLGDLTECEQALVAAVARGELRDLRHNKARLDDPADDPAGGGSWGRERTVRAELLYELMTGKREPQPRAVVLRGARITGALNLEATSLVCPLTLQACFFDGAINLNDGKAAAVAITGCCALHGLTADNLEVQGNLELRKSTLTAVSLFGAHIRGQLSLTGMKLTGGGWPIPLGSATLSPPGPAESTIGQQPAGVALNADGLRVAQDMFCGDGFDAEGEVSLARAKVGGRARGDKARRERAEREQADDGRAGHECPASVPARLPPPTGRCRPGYPGARRHSPSLQPRPAASR